MRLPVPVSIDPYNWYYLRDCYCFIYDHLCCYCKRFAADAAPPQPIAELRPVAPVSISLSYYDSYYNCYCR